MDEALAEPDQDQDGNLQVKTLIIHRHFTFGQ